MYELASRSSWMVEWSRLASSWVWRPTGGSTLSGRFLSPTGLSSVVSALRAGDPPIPLPRRGEEGHGGKSLPMQGLRENH